MVVAPVALAMRRVDRHVRGDAVAGDEPKREVMRQRTPLGRGELRRQRQLPLAGGDAVDARLPRLDGVPECGAIAGPVRRTPGRTMKLSATPDLRV